MATYPAVTTPADGSFVAVPAVAVDRLAVVYSGPVWVSDDATPSIDTALPVPAGGQYFLAANRPIKVARAGAGQAQLRMMDY